MEEATERGGTTLLNRSDFILQKLHSYGKALRGHGPLFPPPMMVAMQMLASIYRYIIGLLYLIYIQVWCFISVQNPCSYYQCTYWQLQVCIAIDCTGKWGQKETTAWGEREKTKRKRRKEEATRRSQKEKEEKKGRLKRGLKKQNKTVSGVSEQSKVSRKCNVSVTSISEVTNRKEKIQNCYGWASKQFINRSCYGWASKQFIPYQAQQN